MEFIIAIHILFSHSFFGVYKLQFMKPSSLYDPACSFNSICIFLFLKEILEQLYCFL